MTSKQIDELEDDKDYDANEPPVLVAIRDLPNTAFKRNLSTKAKLDLGAMININKGMSRLDNSYDEASAVTVATKNSCEGEESVPMNIPQGFFDMDTTQTVNIPKEPKKYRKGKKK